MASNIQVFASALIVRQTASTGIREAPGVSLQIHSLSIVETDTFSFQQHLLHMTAVTIGTGTHPALAVDHTLPWHIMTRRERCHGKADSPRGTSNLSGNRTIGCDITRRHLVDGNVDLRIWGHNADSNILSVRRWDYESMTWRCLV